MDGEMMEREAPQLSVRHFVERIVRVPWRALRPSATARIGKQRGAWPPPEMELGDARRLFGGPRRRAGMRHRIEGRGLAQGETEDFLHVEASQLVLPCPPICWLETWTTKWQNTDGKAKPVGYKPIINCANLNVTGISLCQL